MRIKISILSLLITLLFAAPAVAAEYKVIIHTPYSQADYLQDPINRDSRLLVPLRAIADKMQYQTHWDANTQKVTITGDGTKLEMIVGSKTYTVNGQVKTMDVVPVIHNNRTYVPLRFIGEAFGYYVTTDPWDEYAYITFYPLVEETPWPNMFNDFSMKEDGHYLKPGVTTPLGIRLGQTLDEVFNIYGKPQRIIWTPANGYFNDHIKAWEYQYPKDFTGTLMWHGYFLPNSGVGLYSLDFRNGVLTEYRI